MEPPTNHTLPRVRWQGSQPWRWLRKRLHTASPWGPSRMRLPWLCPHLLQHQERSQASLLWQDSPALVGIAPCLPHLLASEQVKTIHATVQQGPTWPGPASLPCLSPLSPTLPYACHMGLLDLAKTHQVLSLLPAFAPAVSSAWDTLTEATNRPSVPKTVLVLALKVLIPSSRLSLGHTGVLITWLVPLCPQALLRCHIP